jgi:hypothetical protein
VAAASTIEKALRDSLPNHTDVTAAARIGARLRMRSKP